MEAVVEKDKMSLVQQSGLLPVMDAVRVKNEIVNKGRMRPPTILVIGWFGDPVNSIVEMFLRHGCDVCFVGDGAMNFGHAIPNWDIHFSGARNEHVDNGPLGTCDFNARRIPLKTILDFFGQRFDAIFHCQDYTIIESDGYEIDIPYYYYWTEMFIPYIPKAATDVFVVNKEAIEWAQLYYRNKHRYHVMPFALREIFRQYINAQPEKYVHDGTERPFACSFAGKIHGFSFYNIRVALLSKMIKEVPGFKCWAPSYTYTDQFTNTTITLPAIGTDKFLSWPGYLGVLSKTRVGFNIPTHLSPNFRDFEVPAAGAMLLTRETPGFKELGFKDGVNCLTYKDQNEAVEKAKNGYDKRIAFEGSELVRSRHSWKTRFEECIWKQMERKI